MLCQVIHGNHRLNGLKSRLLTLQGCPRHCLGCFSFGSCVFQKTVALFRQGLQYELVANISEQLGLTSLKYQKLGDMVEAIGMPAEKVCTFCWNGREGGCAG